MAEKRWMWEYLMSLPTTGTNGSFEISIPRLANAIAILNASGATLSYAVGKHYSKPANVYVIAPHVYLGLPLEETNILTVFWDSLAPLSVADIKGTFVFSNLDINVQGGAMTTGGVASNVAIVGTPYVNVNGIGAGVSHIGEVSVSALPPLPAGAAHIGEVAVSAMPSIPAGVAHIGEVAVSAMPVVHVVTDSQANPPNLDASLSSLVAAVVAVETAEDTNTTAINAVTTAVDALKTASPLAATSGITSGSKVSVLTTATVLFNGVVTGKQIVIQNQDASNILALGPLTVTMSNAGLTIPAGGSFSLDVVSGSTIVIYGVADSAINVGITVIN